MEMNKLRIEILKNYVKDIKELIKLKHDVIIPNIFLNVHLEITFLERYCHLNSLENYLEIIYNKYKKEIIKDFNKDIKEILEATML